MLMDCSATIFRLLLYVLVAAWCMPAATSVAQLEYDKAPVYYSATKANDAVAALQKRIDKGEVKLKFEDRGGYLKQVLQELSVPQQSQTLVFSKTSLQQRLISPESPRAIYFNDDVYVGFVNYGDVLEISATDPRLGPVFYTLKQQPAEKPQFVRDTGNCLSCHATSRTGNVPGHLVRSVYASPSGLPHYGAGTYDTTHESPLHRRYGGWYVTGRHGKQRHMGNVVATDRQRPAQLDTDAGANWQDLKKAVKPHLFLTGHSDIVALMVLTHQTAMHNYITQASYTTRAALHQSYTMNRVLERPEKFVSQLAQRRISQTCKQLVRHMLFAGEAELTGQITGSSGFAASFQAQGPKDSRGRSLRDLDMKTRMFKYPCSYLIYSPNFDALPAEALKQVYRQLWDVLNSEASGDAGSKETKDEFPHLPAETRRNILQILRETKSGLPDYWMAE